MSRQQASFDLKPKKEKQLELEVSLILAAHISDYKNARELAGRIVSLVAKRLKEEEAG